VISGVQLLDLKQVHDERGSVARMLSSKDPWFSGFGEIYFSTIHPNAVKAWRKHKIMTANYACIEGVVRIVLYDDRLESKTFGELNEFILSPNNYKLLVIAAGIWSGFMGLGEKTSIIANCASIVHDDNEVERIPYNSKDIIYNW
jgi:dTDP-4-dehydrorhamnose 3,5-epimerase